MTTRVTAGDRAPSIAPDVLTPALYDCTLEHTRRSPIQHAFRYRVHLWLVDLDELPALPRWARPIAGFRAADHAGDPNGTLRDNLTDYLAGQGIALPGGRILMLANARSFGHVFNPITVYWCYRVDGELACIVAEVHNTYGGRHRYVLRPDADGRVRQDKEFYVSPFFTVQGEYLMRFSDPGPRLSIRIVLRQHGQTVFTAGLRGSRRRATPAALAAATLRRPAMSMWVAFRIRWHGVLLWVRGLPVIPRPPD